MRYTFPTMRAAVRSLYNYIKRRAIVHFRTKEVLRVYEIAHAQELAATPGNEWPMVKARHRKEILAAQQGNYDIVDRRSWQHPWLPESLSRIHQPIIKNTPYNLRRWSETPIPRRAINLIKNSLLSLQWEITPLEHVELTPEVQMRIDIATKCFNHPNNTESYNELMEAVMDDFLIGGYGCIEPRLTPFFDRPVKMWSVDGSTIRIFADWTESEPDKPRYAQMTGLRGEQGYVLFRDDELLYIRDNVRTTTPFGMGKLEVCFNTISAFIGVQEMSSRAGSDQIHKTFLWWKTGLTPAQLQEVYRHIRNEGEGLAKISIMKGVPTPETVDVQAVNEADLLLGWQEFLIRIIATGFDLSAMSLGVERDVNRATGEVLATSDFRSAVVPPATKIQEYFTRHILHTVLGWSDLQFKYIGLNDPDPLTQMAIIEREYRVDGITSDEIRKIRRRPKLESGIGRLTLSEKQIAIAEANAKATAAQQPATPPGMGGAPSPFGVQKPFGTKPTGMGGSPTMPKAGGKLIMSAKELLKKNPKEIEELRKAKAIPQTSGEIKDSIEEEEPGALQQMSEELQEYFEWLEKQEDTAKVKPSKPKPSDEAEQETKYKKQESRQKGTAVDGRGKDQQKKVGERFQRQPQAQGGTRDKKKKKNKEHPGF